MNILYVLPNAASVKESLPAVLKGASILYSIFLLLIRILANLYFRSFVTDLR